MVAGVIAEPSVSTRKELARLPFIDGLRAVAASLVALQHLTYFVPGFNRATTFQHAPLLLKVLWPARYGNEMVALFLMVSGFSLYYSEVVRRHRGGATPTGVFARRRAWRILPTYYLAFVAGIAVTRLVVWWGDAKVWAGGGFDTHLSAGGVISHLLFVHNLRDSWVLQGNAPLWSMAYEVQLYLLFPLLFWAFTRRPWVAIAAAVVVEALVDRSGVHIFGLIEWFALGCLLAELVARGARLPQRLLFAIGIVVLIVVEVGGAPGLGHRSVHDLAWAVAFSALLLAMAQTPSSPKNPLTWRPVRWLGLRSYSVYVINMPVALLLLTATHRLGLHGTSQVLAMFALGVPAVLLVATLMFELVERPSLARARAVGSNVATATGTGAAAPTR